MNPPSQRAIARVLLLSGAAILAPLTATTAAQAKLASYGPAKLVSVDGPARLTIKTKTKTIKVRVDGIDTPAPATATTPAECGAVESAAALQRVAKKYATKLRYSLYDPRRVDSEGRYRADVHYEHKRYSTSVIEPLIAQGWARYGHAGALGAVPPADIEGSDEDPLEAVLPANGVWSKCGGRMHLPGGQPAPSTAPATWSIDAFGVAHAAGPILLPTALTPDTTPTLGSVAATVGATEVLGSDSDCTLVIPQLQLLLAGIQQEGLRRPCGELPVFVVASYGPGAVSSDRGLKGGDAKQRVKELFPRVILDTSSEKEGGTNDSESISLSGPGFQPWPWQTTVGLVDGKVQALLAYAPAISWLSGLD